MRDNNFCTIEFKSGYICALEPYFGKTTTKRLARQDLGVTSRIVLHLVNKLKESHNNIEGLQLFCDQYYTNLDLAAAIYDMKIHVTDTMMRNRLGLPEQNRPSRKRKVI